VLSQASAYDDGWTVVDAGLSIAAAAVCVEKDGEKRYLAAPSVVPTNPLSLNFKVGDSVFVRQISSEYVNGFWNTFSPVWTKEGMPVERQRFYFSVISGQEREFINAFCSAAPLTENWSMKILAGQIEGERQDVAVAYLPKSVDLSSRWLEDLITCVQNFASGTGPRLTIPIVDGVSWAPEFADDKSYGQVVCDTLATTFAHADARHSDDAWLKYATNNLKQLFAEYSL